MPLDPHVIDGHITAGNLRAAPLMPPPSALYMVRLRGGSQERKPWTSSLWSVGQSPHRCGITCARRQGEGGTILPAFQAGSYKREDLCGPRNGQLILYLRPRPSLLLSSSSEGFLTAPWAATSKGGPSPTTLWSDPDICWGRFLEPLCRVLCRRLV